MSDLDHARLMLKLSRDELNALEGMQESPLFTTGIFGFHAQQCVEKGLKAWLSLIGVGYPITHSLTILLDLLADNGVKQVADYRPLTRLTPFAVQFRYEEYDELAEVFDRSDLIEEIREFLEGVSAAIESKASQEDETDRGESEIESNSSD